MNVKFWVYENDTNVRITLKPGQKVSHSTGGICEEGYEWTHTEWFYEGNRIVRKWHRDARDCDGRITADGEEICMQWATRSGYEDPENPELKYPDWISVEESQRDYSAEAMGY